MENLRERLEFLIALVIGKLATLEIAVTHNEEQLFNTDEAADFLEVSGRTLRRYKKRGYINRYVIAGLSYYRESELIEFKNKPRN